MARSCNIKSNLVNYGITRTDLELLRYRCWQDLVISGVIL